MISIVICTYNRSHILMHCIDSILKQESNCIYEVVIVNNGNDKATHVLIENYKRIDEKFNRICKEVIESEIGLSIARNTGARESKYEWLFYLDDDAKLPLGFINELYRTIVNYNFDCFTGTYRAWFLEKPPAWLEYSYGTKYIEAEKVQSLNNDYLSGGVLAIRKLVLMKLGGFPTNLGMKENIIAYGEENYVEQKLREGGYGLGINPHLIIDHLVMRHKYDYKWHLKSHYAKGRDSWHYNKALNDKSTFRILLLMIQKLVITTSKSLVKLLIRPNYYWMNGLLDIAQPQFFLLGLIKGKFSNKVIS